jgi:biotin carboxyl carrier protein
MGQNFEIKINDKLLIVQLLKEDGNILQLSVDGRKYEVDLVSFENGIFSILHKNKSYNVELIEGETNKKFVVNTLYKSYDVEIVDAESRYLSSRNQSKELAGNNLISSPMPGRIVRIPVIEGQEVVAGQTVIVVSAMKMESEYKAPKNGFIRQIHVKEGDVVTGHQPLVTIE